MAAIELAGVTKRFAGDPTTIAGPHVRSPDALAVFMAVETGRSRQRRGRMIAASTLALDDVQFTLADGETLAVLGTVGAAARRLCLRVHCRPGGADLRQRAVRRLRLLTTWNRHSGAWAWSFQKLCPLPTPASL